MENPFRKVYNIFTKFFHEKYKKSLFQEHLKAQKRNTDWIRSEIRYLGEEVDSLREMLEYNQYGLSQLAEFSGLDERYNSLEKLKKIGEFHSLKSDKIRVDNFLFAEEDLLDYFSLREQFSECLEDLIDRSSSLSS